MRSLEERLRSAIAGIEERDGKLRDELAAVRASSKPTAMEMAPGLESLGFGVPEGPGGGPRAAPDLALETIVLRTGRPVLAVFNDQAKLEFNDADSEVWRARLVAAKDQLGRAIRAVGRIEVEHHPRQMDWLGTGWLVAPDVIVTNRHVAQEFGLRRGEGFVFKQGLGGTMTARIDFLEEYGRAAAREFKVTNVLHIQDEPGPDVAFLKVEQRAGDGLAAPIVLASRPADQQRQVAVIGYPARDSRIPEQDLMLQIFGNVFDKKRLAPGQVMRIDRGLLLHDCSTLGGNSGSVVLDLDSGEAVALHFSGRFLEANYAVPAPTVAEVLRARGRAPAKVSVRPPVRPRAEAHAASADVVLGDGGGGGLVTGSVDLTIPLRVRVSLGTPALDRRPAAPPPAPTAVAGEEGEEDGEAFEEGRVEDYSDRRGYLPGFLGFDVKLPGIRANGDVLEFDLGGRKEHVLRYEHFSVVMSESRRLCFYSASNVDGSRSRRMKRPGWRLDPRIPTAAQIRGECYGNEPKFARGHMTRREDPVWGTEAEAERGNSDSMHVTNVVPQMQPFNAGIWLELENYALEHARQDDMKISVFTGPVFREDDPLRYGVAIPRSFWKVIAFVHDETGEPCATAYTLNQEDYLREEEFVFGRHETAQVPLSVIEATAGVTFPDALRRLDPLERVAEARPMPLRDFRDIRFR